jgi:hypothetical protein
MKSCSKRHAIKQPLENRAACATAYPGCSWHYMIRHAHHFMSTFTNRLMQDSFQADQIRNREGRLWRHSQYAIVRYMAPNGYVFTIDARPLDHGGVPHITSEAARGCVASSATHTLGDGTCCIAEPRALREMDLCTLLVHIDSWARGMELYKAGYAFPASPREAFSPRHCPRGNNQYRGAVGLLERLFG